MERQQLVVSILLVSLLMVFLVGFLFLMLFLQRKKSNKFIAERENMKRLFEEQLLRSQLEIQEVSFNTISMEIHDNVGQTLSLLKMQLNIMEQKGFYDLELIKAAKSSAGRAMSDLRDIAKGLNSEIIAHASFVDMISGELYRIGELGSICTHILVDNQEISINSDKKLILFRIIQECMQNAIKHSNLSEMRVRIAYLEDRMTIDVEDNGRGFDQEKMINNGQGMGLQNILKRAKIIGGEAVFSSEIDRGTTVSIYCSYE